MDITKYAAWGDVEKVRKALEAGADPSIRENDPLRQATQEGHDQVVAVLLQDPRVNPSVDNNWPIKIASSLGHEDVVRVFLKDGRADPSVDNNYPLREASANGHIEVVALLLSDKRVDPTLNENVALRAAIDSAKNNREEVVKLFLMHPYVDWSLLRDTDLEHLVNAREHAFRSSLVPVMGKFRRNIPGRRAYSALGRNAALQEAARTLCDDLMTGTVPSVELIDLVRMLVKQGYMEDVRGQGLTKGQVCRRIRDALLAFVEENRERRN